MTSVGNLLGNVLYAVMCDQMRNISLYDLPPYAHVRLATVETLFSSLYYLVTKMPKSALFVNKPAVAL